MSIIGNGSLSLRKKDIKESSSIAVGFKRLVFAHKATAGQTGINLASLTTPTEMSSQGFVNATLNDITTSNLLFFRNNLSLVSSSKGRLVDYLSYSVASGTQINFNGFTAEEGEIFVGVIDNDAKTGQNIVDARPISATGLLTVGTTDFNVGTPFEVGKYITSQVGAVIVFRNGQVQFRNAANSSSSTDGNYYEVDPGGGLGTVIRFNTAATLQDDNILVVSNGLVAERPTGSMMATIENINGQLNNMAGYVADAVGSTSSTVLGAAPSNVDLKAFGDTVYSQGVRITTLESKIPTAVAIYRTTGGQSLASGASTQISFTTKVRDDFNLVSNPSSTWRYTARKIGFLRVSCTLRLDPAGGAWAVGNQYEIVVYKNGSPYGDIGFMQAHWTDSNSVGLSGSIDVDVSTNDYVEIFVFHNKTGTLTTGAGQQGFVSVSEIYN